MKKQYLVVSITLFCTLFFCQTTVLAKDVMIILQENQGKVGILNLPNSTPSNVVTWISATIDAAAENFEAIKSSLQGTGKYESIIDLTDAKCTRRNLLQTLISESEAGNEIDIFFFGHGGENAIELHGEERLIGGRNGSLQSMLSEARARKGVKFNFNIRLVYSCACHGAGLNDDWLAIGAKTSVGSLCNNWMAEPMISKFLHKYVHQNKPVADASREAFNEAKIYWSAASLAAQDLRTSDPADLNCSRANRLEGSLPIVAGNAAMQFSSAQHPTPNLIDVVTGNLPMDLPEGTYYIQESINGHFLDIDGGSNGSRVFVNYRGERVRDNQWRFRKVRGLLKGYTIENNLHRGKYIDADFANTGTNGCRVQVWERTGPTGNVNLLNNGNPISTNQEWYVEGIGNNKYRITNVKSNNMALDARDDGAIDSRIKLYRKNASDNSQIFILKKVD